MTTRFTGFPREMPAFFRGLERNNRREWFAPRKELFEAKIRAPMIELVTILNDQFRTFSLDHVAEEPARLLYRIYRDTRFSKDKTPYKTHLGATFAHRTLPRHGGAGYYFEISHRYVGIAGGVYMPGPEELLAIRSAIAARPAEFLKLLSNPSTRKMFGALQGESLKRLPKPWQKHADAPEAEHLKRKQFFWWIELPASIALTPRLPAILTRHFRAMHESLQWFNRAILAHHRRNQDESRPERPAPMW
jgi:uncharacterized protein (TIGR02453 family)